MSVNGKMTAIADAIRSKTGKTALLTLDQMAAEIADIQTGGGSMFTSSAGGILPTVYRGVAHSELAVNFEISATGVLQEV